MKASMKASMKVSMKAEMKASMMKASMKKASMKKASMTEVERSDRKKAVRQLIQFHLSLFQLYTYYRCVRVDVWPPYICQMPLFPTNLLFLGVVAAAVEDRIQPLAHS